MGLSLVRIKGLHCKQSVNGKHIFVHCSVTVNLALPMLHSSTPQSSANERIKSMWLEAKYEWCNKMLVSIWWSEDGGGLGKETVTSCALDVRLATISGFPTSAFLLSRMLSTKFSLWLWNIHRVEEWGRHLGALLWLELCLLTSWPCHAQCLCPCMHIWWPSLSRSFLLAPVWIVNVEWEKVWFQGCCARCCLDVVKVAFYLLDFCCFMEKTDFLQSLLLVWSLTLHAILQPFCNDRYDC